MLAALIAVQQNDIKRILAYSTLSQLGYMVMAVGLGGPTPAMFHLTTHAFFKALLFLSAGSVIIGAAPRAGHLEDGQPAKENAGHVLDLSLGTLALRAVCRRSAVSIQQGHHSRRRRWTQHNYLLFAVGVFVAGLTTFYMFRLFFVVFFGKEKSEAAAHAHESPAVMTCRWWCWPCSRDWRLHRHQQTSTARNFRRAKPRIRSALRNSLFEPFMHSPAGRVAWARCRCRRLFRRVRRFITNAATDPLPAKLGGLATAMKNKFYFDELYEATFIRAHDFIAAVMDWIDRWLVEGLCIGLVRGGTDLTGRALRLVQTGNLQTYAFLFVLGVAVVLYFVLVK